MKLTTIREIYKNREAYLDKEVTVGGWVRSVRCLLYTSDACRR